MAGGDLHIPQVHPGLEHGGHDGAVQRVWAQPRNRRPPGDGQEDAVAALPDDPKDAVAGRIRGWLATQ